MTYKEKNVSVKKNAGVIAINPNVSIQTRQFDIWHFLQNTI